MRKVLVTGGAGFIGSNLVRRLLARGDAVRVLDDFSSGKRENLSEIARDIELIEGDLRDPAAVRRGVEGVEIVHHLAALGSVPRSIADPASTHAVNASGTFELLLASRDAGVRRLVFASSSSVYGKNPTLPQHEDLPLSPISPYGASKAIGEMYCKSFSAAYGIETVCLRYYNVFGPRQDPTSEYAAAIPRFVSALLREQPPTIFDDGEQSRGFTFVDNVLDANCLAAEAPGLSGEAINVSTPTAVTVNTVVFTVRELLGKRHVSPVYAPPRAGDIKFSLADVQRAKQLLGFEAKISFDEGIRRAIAWYREHLA